MIVVKRRLNGRKAPPVEFPVYTKEEADANGIKYVYWKEAEKDLEAEWVRSDDDYVCQILKRRLGYLMTSISVVSYRRDKKFIALERIVNRSYCRFGSKSWIDRRLKEKPIQEYVRALAEAYFYKRAVDWDKLGRKLDTSNWGNEHTIYRAIALQFLKHQEVKKAVRDEIKKIFAENGITEETPAGLFAKAIQIARTKEDAKLLLQAATQLYEMFEANEKKPQGFIPLEATGFAPEFLKRIEQANVEVQTSGIDEFLNPSEDNKEVYVDPTKVQPVA